MCFTLFEMHFKLVSNVIIMIFHNMVFHNLSQYILCESTKRTVKLENHIVEPCGFILYMIACDTISIPG